ncbi:MAG: NAD-dependent epimerase/dehydratase family protein [Phycisphaera sp.]|nr:NAD-dependent epimerase/dehydratase family protein [Phycisphaera sp.]
MSATPEPSPQPTILVTGSAGCIGGIVCRSLRKAGLRVRGLDVNPSQDADESVVGSIADFDTVLKATEGCARVIHLGATINDQDFLTLLLPNNILGVYHILESARLKGVRAVVLASSVQAVNALMQRDEGNIRVTEFGPDNLYAASKLWAEHAGQSYALQHKLNVLAVRIGWLPHEASKTCFARKNQLARDLFLSHEDAARFFLLTATQPITGYHCVFAASRPESRTVLDLEPARALLGYEPQNTYPQGLPFTVE